jgi:hypothetical protein
VLFSEALHTLQVAFDVFCKQMMECEEEPVLARMTLMAVLAVYRGDIVRHHTLLNTDALYRLPEYGKTEGSIGGYFENGFAELRLLQSLALPESCRKRAVGACQGRLVTSYRVLREFGVDSELEPPFTFITKLVNGFAI